MVCEKLLTAASAPSFVTGCTYPYRYFFFFVRGRVTRAWLFDQTPVAWLQLLQKDDVLKSPAASFEVHWREQIAFEKQQLTGSYEFVSLCCHHHHHQLLRLLSIDNFQLLSRVILWNPILSASSRTIASFAWQVVDPNITMKQYWSLRVSANCSGIFSCREPANCLSKKLFASLWNVQLHLLYKMTTFRMLFK